MKITEVTESPTVQTTDPAADIAEQELQTGITLSSAVEAKIKQCLEHVLNRQEDPGVKLFGGQSTHRIFTLDVAPGLIFKIDENPQATTIPARYEKLKRAYQVVRAHQLGLLVIPHAKLCALSIEGRARMILVEQKVDINQQSIAQNAEDTEEQNYHDQADHLTETVRQLALFICRTGFSDVAWRNIPLVRDSVDERGNRRIALIDLEEMGNPVKGLFGGYKRRGLVGCVTKEQGLLVREIAEHEHVTTTEFAEVFRTRTRELEEDLALQAFYEAKHIHTGFEPLTVDEKALDFSAFPEFAVELKQFTLELLPILNDLIRKANPDSPLKKKRLITLSIYDVPRGEIVKARQLITVRDDQKEQIEELERQESFTSAYSKATFLGQVIVKLVDLQVLFGLKHVDGYGWHLQA